MSKRQQQIGKAGEELALNVLAARGVRIPERIATPAKMVGGRMIYEGKVSGDINGILDNGIRVIAEVKTIQGRNLRWSDLRPHQPGRLDINKSYKGISLLVWVHDSGVLVLDWVYPNDDFGPGKGLNPIRAAALNVMDVNKLVKDK